EAVGDDQVVLPARRRLAHGVLQRRVAAGGEVVAHGHLDGAVGRCGLLQTVDHRLVEAAVGGRAADEEGEGEGVTARRSIAALGRVAGRGGGRRGGGGAAVAVVVTAATCGEQGADGQERDGNERATEVHRGAF